MNWFQKLCVKFGWYVIKKEKMQDLHDRIGTLLIAGDTIFCQVISHCGKRVQYNFAKNGIEQENPVSQTIFADIDVPNHEIVLRITRTQEVLGKVCLPDLEKVGEFIFEPLKDEFYNIS